MLARTRVGFGGSPETIFVFATPGKFSEGRSERPDVTEASGGTAPALAAGGKGVWSHTTDSSYAFGFKDFNFNSSYVLTGWSIISGELTVDATGNATAGPATVHVYDPNGV
jgi:hypothetical protein